MGTTEQVIKNHLRSTFDKLGVWTPLNWRCMLPATVIRIGVGKPITPLRPWDDQKPANDAKPPMGPISRQLPLWLAGNQMRSNHFHLRYFCKSFPLDHFFCADQSN
jgi:hypothetical protein